MTGTSPCGAADPVNYVWTASPLSTVTADSDGKVIASSGVPSAIEDAYPVTITITDITFDDNGESLITSSLEAKVMMGDCENVLYSGSTTFAATSSTAFKSLDPYFVIPSDTDLFSFGTGG